MTVCDHCGFIGGYHARYCPARPSTSQQKEETVTTTDQAPAVELRHTPVQARGQKRLDEILVAARKALAIHGRDRFTTAQVADLAGASIGTVYRYFPDRVAILDVIFPDREQTLPAEVVAA